MAVIFNSIDKWFEFRKSGKLKSKSIGFVPTMGALHEGHISLFNKSIEENERTVASIFINPTQFNDPDDLKKYPRSFDADRIKLEKLGVDYIIYPEYNDIYNDDFKYEVNEKEFSKVLCGATRPGHFTGVLTIVMKLLNLVKADKAYFGEKDYQQYLLIKGMSEAFFIDTEIVSCPTVRESDGLAMSSRNLLLSEAERNNAAKFYKYLCSRLSKNEVINKLTDNGFKVDYIEVIYNRRFGAVFLGKVRLIDNVEL